MHIYIISQSDLNEKGNRLAYKTKKSTSNADSKYSLIKDLVLFLLFMFVLRLLSFMVAR